METRRAGETILFEYKVLDEDNQPIDVSLGLASLTFTGVHNGVSVIAVCNITTNTITAELTAEDTAVDGIYEVEIWLFFNGKDDCLLHELLTIGHSSKPLEEEIPN